jgi:hypothetical protein
MPAEHVRVTLRYIEILDSKDLDPTGEFRFVFRVVIPEQEREVVTHIPDEGKAPRAISEHPAMNRVTFDQVLFEGPVNDGEQLMITATGEEHDRFSPNDLLTPYERVLTGPVEGWLGEYSPWDEGAAGVVDPEQLGDWRFAYAIERVAAGVPAE